jgi:hypothetical protein
MAGVPPGFLTTEAQRTRREKTGRVLRITKVVTKIDSSLPWSFLAFLGFLSVLRVSVVVLVRNAG